VAYSPDGRHALTGGDDRTARIWDTGTGEQQLTLTGHPGGVRAVAYSPDGRHALTGGEDDGTARIWDTGTGEQVGWRLELLPEGQAVVWDAATGELRGASEQAWYWLSWQVMVDGVLDRLPAETYGPLPPLSGTPST
jgi:WD40 repeat protein